MSENLNQTNHYEPSQELRDFCYALLASGVTPNFRDTERQTGISRGKFHYAHRTSEEFRNWYKELSSARRSSQRIIVDHSLIEAIKKGDVPAMRLFYELEGDIKSKGTEVNVKTFVNNKGSNGNVNVSAEDEAFVNEQRKWLTTPTA